MFCSVHANSKPPRSTLDCLLSLGNTLELPEDRGMKARAASCPIYFLAVIFFLSSAAKMHVIHTILLMSFMLMAISVDPTLWPLEMEGIRHASGTLATTTSAVFPFEAPVIPPALSTKSYPLNFTIQCTGCSTGALGPCISMSSTSSGGIVSLCRSPDNTR